MRTFGVMVSHDNYRVFHIRGRQTLYRAAITVEGDASSASTSRRRRLSKAAPCA